MSHSQDKIKASRRRLCDENAVQRQTKIAQIHGAPTDEPHRFVKHHAMNCGQPGCILCSNPRRIFKQKTIQEKRMYQNFDQPTNEEDHD
jgi:hypothetical protein